MRRFLTNMPSRGVWVTALATVIGLTGASAHAQTHKKKPAAAAAPASPLPSTWTRTRPRRHRPTHRPRLRPARRSRRRSSTTLRPATAGQPTEAAAQAKRLYDREKWWDAAKALYRVSTGETGDDEGNKQIAQFNLAKALYKLKFYPGRVLDLQRDRRQARTTSSTTRPSSGSRSSRPTCRSRPTSSSASASTTRSTSPSSTTTSSRSSTGSSTTCSAGTSTATASSPRRLGAASTRSTGAASTTCRRSSSAASRTCRCARASRRSRRSSASSARSKRATSRSRTRRACATSRTSRWRAPSTRRASRLDETTNAPTVDQTRSQRRGQVLEQGRRRRASTGSTRSSRSRGRTSWPATTATRSATSTRSSRRTSRTRTTRRPTSSRPSSTSPTASTTTRSRSSRSSAGSYEPIRDELAKILDKFKGENQEEEFYKFLKDVRDDKAQLDPKVAPIVKTSLSDRQLLRNLEYVRLLDEEDGRFKKAPNSFKDAKVADLVKDSVHDARELAVRNAGNLARGRYQRNLADLNEQLRNGQKILIDITAAKRNELDQAMARPAGHRRGVEGQHRQARRGARHLAVPGRILARRARVLPPDDHVEVREVAMNRVLSLWVGVPAVVLGLLLGGGASRSRRPTRSADGLGGASSASSSSSSSGPVCVPDSGEEDPRHLSGGAGHPVGGPRQGAGDVVPLEGGGPQEGRQADRRRNGRRGHARRHPRRSVRRALKQRALGAPRDRDPAARVALALDREHVAGPAQAAPPSRRGLRRARERGLPREDRRRGRARRRQEGQPARGAEAAVDRDLAQDDDGEVAQGGHPLLLDARRRLLRSALDHVPAEPAAGVRGCSTRSTTTSPTSTSSRATRRTRAASTSTSSRRRRTRSTSRTRTSPSASSSSTRRRATRRSGSRPSRRTRRSSRSRRPTTRCTATPGTSWRTSSGTRAISRTRSTRSRRRSTSGRSSRSSRTRRSSPRARRKDLIPVYALAGSPTDAYNFFKNLSGDAAGSTDKTFKMMDDLGQNYLDTGHYPEAIALYKDLMVRDNGSDKQCEYQSHITEATMAMKSGDKNAIVIELLNQFKTYNALQRRQPRGRREAEVREPHGRAGDRDRDGVAPRGRRLRGAARHRRPEDDGPRRGPLQEGGRHLEVATTSRSSSSRASSRTTGRRSTRSSTTWPTSSTSARSGRSAARRSTPSSQEDPKAPEAAESAYAAVLCYQNIYLAQHAKGSDKKGTGNLPGVGKDIKAGLRRQVPARRT